MNPTTTEIPSALGRSDRPTPRRAFLRTSILAAGAGLLLSSRLRATGELAPASGDMLEVFRKRRSVRRFKADAVPEADIRRILDAARSAPTSGNQQPWKFLVVRDPATIKALKEASIERAVAKGDSGEMASAEEKSRRLAAAQKAFDGYFSAPVYIVVLTDNRSTYPDYNHWDGPLAAGYLMLAARALGYGTVFITDAIADEVTKRVLAIPERYSRVCITPLGVPVAWPDSPAKKPLEDFIAWEKL